MNELEKEKQLLYNSNQNLEKDISELKNKIFTMSKENESQIKLINESKKELINNYEKQITEFNFNMRFLIFQLVAAIVLKRLPESMAFRVPLRSFTA